MKKRKKRLSKADKLRSQLPSATNWDTSDQHELDRRRLRAIEEPPISIENKDPHHPIYSNFTVRSQSGAVYSVEIRDLENRVFSSNTVDFQINGLGTDKHVEAVLNYLQKKHRIEFNEAFANGSDRVDIIPLANVLKVERNLHQLPKSLRSFVNEEGVIHDVESFLEVAKQSKSKKLRISQEVTPWLEEKRQDAERKLLRREYEQKIVSGAYPAHETKIPLYPYQREGMLHLAFTERALLADEMGLGKTIQALAACALLHRLGKAKRVLVVSPASLKSEWEEQIQKFTDLGKTIVFGNRTKRKASYKEGVFFTLVNYEQVMRDFEVINELMQPDIVVLDEAQRIKNWSTKTAQSIKRLKSRYAFVLTGTPIENRIDDLYSIVNFINPTMLGSLFRFNREYYKFDENGRPSGYQNLDRLHEQINPLMMRRRKIDVETELPDRTDRTLFVPMTSIQTEHYDEHKHQVGILRTIAERRPLRKEELDKLQRELAMMRMMCDTPYILDPEEKACPKLREIKTLLDELLADADVKIVIFSEWVKMLELVREHCEAQKIGNVWHTGSVPQVKRREEINRFKNDPDIRIFLSSDSGGVGLNLQNASVVINCDLPWNPAKLEQRIARVWRKHQTRSVTVIKLVSENTIEHRMIETLFNKQNLADAVIDRTVEFEEVKMSSGGSKKLLERLNELMIQPGKGQTEVGKKKKPQPVPEAKQPFCFAERLSEMLGDQLLDCVEHNQSSENDSIPKIVITVTGNPQQVKDSIINLSREVFQKERDIEIIDQQTSEALNRLIDAGLFQCTSNTRSLLSGNSENSAQLLSADQLKRLKELKTEAKRKCAMAKLLVDNSFPDGAIQPLQDAIERLTIHNILQTGFLEPEEGNIDYKAHWDPAIASFMTTPTTESVHGILKFFDQKMKP